VLNCQNFGFTNPVNLTLNGAGVATAASYTLTQQQATATGAAATASPSASASPTAGGDPVTTNPFMRKHRHQNLSGM
jgi:hypothetical protein